MADPKLSSQKFNYRNCSILVLERDDDGAVAFFIKAHAGVSLKLIAYTTMREVDCAIDRLEHGLPGWVQRFDNTRTETQ